MKNNMMKKIWNWTKDHKKEIIITAATAVGGICLIKAGVDCVKIVKNVKSNMALPNPEGFIPEIGVGTVGDYARYERGDVELWMDNIPLAELGKLGEEIANKVPDVPENPVVWALLSVRPGETVEVET